MMCSTSIHINYLGKESVSRIGGSDIYFWFDYLRFTHCGHCNCLGTECKVNLLFVILFLHSCPFFKRTVCPFVHLQSQELVALQETLPGSEAGLDEALGKEVQVP